MCDLDFMFPVEGTLRSVFCVLKTIRCGRRGKLSKAAKYTNRDKLADLSAHPL